MPQDNTLPPFADFTTLSQEDVDMEKDTNAKIDNINSVTPNEQLAALAGGSDNYTQELLEPVDATLGLGDESFEEVMDQRIRGIGDDLDELGLWIVQNEDLKGTADFNTVAEEFARLDQIANEAQQVVDEDEQLKQNLINSQPYQKVFGPLREASPSESGTMQDFALSAAGGALEVGSGLNQILLGGAEAIGIPGAKGLKEDFTEFAGQAFDEIDRRTSDSPIAGVVGDIGGKILPLAFSPIKTQPSLLPQMNVSMQGTLQLKNAGNLVKNAAEFAALEASLFKNPEDRSRADAALAGGATGALVTTLLSGAGVLGRAVSKSDAAKATTQRLDDLSKEFKVPLTLGEVRDSRGLQWLESVLDYAPVMGLGKFRNEQLVSLKDAANRMVQSIGGVVDDVGETLDRSLRAVLAGNKKASKKEYDAVRNAMGDDIVPMTNTARVSSETNASLQVNKDLLGANPAEAGVKRIDEATNPAPIKSEIIDRLGRQIEVAAVPAQKTWGQLRELRTDIGNKLTKAIKGVQTGSADFTEVQALTNIKKAIEADLEAAVLAKGGDALKRWKTADANYKSKVIPFQKGALKRSLADGIDKDTIISNFLRSERKGVGTGVARAKQLFGNTTKEGQQAVKYSLLTSAWERAVVAGEFSPKVFKDTLQTYKKQREVILSKAEQKTIDDFIEVAARIRRAEQGGTTAINPVTRRAMYTTQQALTGGGIAAGVGAGGQALGAAAVIPMLKLAAGIKGASVLLSTQKGRNILAGLKSKDPSELAKRVAEANSEIASITSKMLKADAAGDEG